MAKNLKVLVSGCSFSESQPSYNPNDEQQWKPWSDFLSEKYDVKNVARGSYGNFGISKSIVKEILHGYQPHLVIIQWSGLVRRMTKHDSDLVMEVLKTPQKNLELVGLDFHSLENLEKYYKALEYSSLQEILLVQEFLEKRDIPYICFWGWRQLVKQHKYMDLIYNNNWILNDNNFGFLNHVIKKWDKESACVHDGHPNTRSQKWLFEQILSRIQKSLI